MCQSYCVIALGCGIQSPPPPQSAMAGNAHVDYWKSNTEAFIDAKREQSLGLALPKYQQWVMQDNFIEPCSWTWLEKM